MKVSYNGLWKLLIDHEMKKMDLVEELGISTSTLAKMIPPVLKKKSRLLKSES